jgi:hypothetical protein
MTQTFLWFLLQTTTIGGRLKNQLSFMNDPGGVLFVCCMLAKGKIYSIPFHHFPYSSHTLLIMVVLAGATFTSLAPLYTLDLNMALNLLDEVYFDATATLYVLDLHNWPQLLGQRILYAGKIIMKAYPNLMSLITVDIIITLSTGLYILSLIHFPTIALLPRLYILSLTQLSFITILSSSMYRYYQPSSIKDLDHNPVISCKLLP